MLLYGKNVSRAAWSALLATQGHKALGCSQLNLRDGPDFAEDTYSCRETPERRREAAALHQHAEFRRRTARESCARARMSCAMTSAPPEILKFERRRRVEEGVCVLAADVLSSGQ